MIIILAPHLEFPLRNGSDIYVERLGCYLSLKRERVITLGATTVTFYEKGFRVSQEGFNNTFRSKIISALRTILRGSHYLIEKFLTPQYIAIAHKLISDNPGSLVICSYILSASVLNNKKTLNSVVILTHNDEVAWFKQQRVNSSDPLLKIVSFFSEKWLLRFLQLHETDYVFAHIAESDYISYQNYIPRHRGIVVPAGVEIVSPMNIFPKWDGVIKLFFCGSLGVKMNCDALIYFSEYYWTILQDRFAGKLVTWIAGSQPTSLVRNLCAKQKWQLFSDISSDSLAELYRLATFGILPFSYTNGAKIKLLNYMEAGLPVLATTNMKYIEGQDFPPSLYSDSPNEWSNHLEGIMVNGVRSRDRVACHQFAKRFTWESIACEMDRELKLLKI